MTNTNIEKPTMAKNKQKKLINLRDELKGGENKQKDYQLDYGVNQKRRTIERLTELLEEAKELPTETYEYGYYSINTTLENFEAKLYDLKGKGEDKGHSDETG